MADIDKQKEFVNFIRTLFFFLLATIFGLIGFEFLHYKSLSNIELILINIVLLILILSDIIVLKALLKNIDKLKDL